MRVKFSVDADDNIEILDSDYEHEYVNIVQEGNKKIFTVSTPDVYINLPDTSNPEDNA